MPHIQITMLEGRTTEQKRRTAKRITEVVAEELQGKPEKLTITFVEVPRENWSSGGVLICDRTEPK